MATPTVEETKIYYLRLCERKEPQKKLNDRAEQILEEAISRGIEKAYQLIDESLMMVHYSRKN